MRKTPFDPIFYMREALKEADLAQKIGEVPIGAVVVDQDGSIIGRGHNRRETDSDVSSHAELNAIKDAAKTINTWRLDDCTVYVTLEPCFMCASAIMQARVKHLSFAAKDPKAGAVESLTKFYELYPQNHEVSWDSGLLADEASQLLKSFFKSLRQRNKRDNKAYGGRGKRAIAASERLLEKPGDPE